MTKTLDTTVLDILSRCTIDERGLHLPGQLPRPHYEAVAKALELMGAKWDRSAKCHVTGSTPEELQSALDAAIASGQVVDLKKSYQFFETPEPIADRMADRLADLYNRPGMLILDPSAGTGRLGQAVRRNSRFAFPELWGVEIQPNLRAKLIESSAPIYGRVDCGDFLTVAPKMKHKFDGVIMNPPFSNLQDVDHVMAALDLLGHQGAVVAIMSKRWTFGTDRKSTQFRDVFESLARYGMATMETIEAGAFSQSGTMIETLLVTLGGKPC